MTVGGEKYLLFGSSCPLVLFSLQNPISYLLPFLLSPKPKIPFSSPKLLGDSLTVDRRWADATARRWPSATAKRWPSSTARRGGSAWWTFVTAWRWAGTVASRDGQVVARRRPGATVRQWPNSTPRRDGQAWWPGAMAMRDSPMVARHGGRAPWPRGAGWRTAASFGSSDGLLWLNGDGSTV
jgi:hypothetical protein